MCAANKKHHEKGTNIVERVEEGMCELPTRTAIKKDKQCEKREEKGMCVHERVCEGSYPVFFRQRVYDLLSLALQHLDVSLRILRGQLTIAQYTCTEIGVE